MKKSDLKVGDRIIQIADGAGANMPLEITDIDNENKIIGMGHYCCSLENVEKGHKYVNSDGSLEEIIR